MPNDNEADERRARALAKITTNAGATPTEIPEPELRRMLHELQVHQIELELQNEELVRTRGEVEGGLARYTTLYEHAPVGYLTLGGDGEILQLNLAASQLLGPERAPLVGRHLGTLVPVEQRPTLSAWLATVTRLPGRHTCELRLEREDTVVVVALAGLRIDDSDHCRVVATDVTEARRASRALHESEARYRTLFQLSSDALVTLAPPSWRFTSGNAAAVALFGSVDEVHLRARTMAELSPPRQPDGTDSTMLTTLHLEAAVRDGARVFDWTLCRSDGTPFPAQVSLSPMLVGGRPLLHASVRDQTEAQMRQARTAQADRLVSLGLLAASLAHEINNPLTYTLYNLETLAADLPLLSAAASRCAAALREGTDAAGYAARVGPGVEWLEKTALDDVVERTERSLEGVERIRDVIRGLTNFSLADPPVPVGVDIPHAIHAAIALASNQLLQRARVVTEFGDVPAARGSASDVSQVLLNLLVNAAHALGPNNVDEGRIEVRTWAQGDDVHVSVADNGGGIAPHNLTRIFEPFFTTNEAGKGAGLGLGICRSVATGLGGDLNVDSTLGVGTRFVLRLPRFVAPTDPQDQTSPPPPPTPCTRGRVLLVDDEPLVRAALNRLLRGEHDVVAAPSGAQAQALLTTDTDFDVILCDLMMPGISGLELHQWLLTHDIDVAARVVFVTGGAFSPRAEAYLEQFGNLQIEKPFAGEEVKRLVSDMVAAARPRRSTPRDPTRGSHA